MDSTDSTWMLSVEWPQSWRLCMCQILPHGWRFCPQPAPWLDILPVTHRNLPCHFHPSPPETHVSLGWNFIDILWVKLPLELKNVTWFVMDLAIILTHTDFQTNLRATKYVYIYIYQGACSFYTTPNFLHLLGHPLQQLLFMEEMRLTNSYPVRYMYGTLTTFGWSLCLNVGKYTKHGSSGYRI